MEHQFLAVHYQLYTLENGEKTLVEQTTPERPFQFISGFGVSLDALEQQILHLGKGTKFDFTLKPEEAFGEYIPEGVHKLERSMFEIDGKFDSQHVYPGAVITLNDSEQNRFMAQVTKVEPDSVTVDTNHPLAGTILNFIGEMMENRPATDDEVNALIKHMTGGCGGCGGHCGNGDCGDGCDDGGCGEGGCGHCHG